MYFDFGVFACVCVFFPSHGCKVRTCRRGETEVKYVRVDDRAVGFTSCPNNYTPAVPRPEPSLGLAIDVVVSSTGVDNDRTVAGGSRYTCMPESLHARAGHTAKYPVLFFQYYRVFDVYMYDVNII